MHWIHWSSVSVNTSIKAGVFVSLLGWSIQVCVNTMPRRKDISNDLREAVIAAHQSGKTISKLFGVPHFTMKKIIHKWKTLTTVVNLSRSGHPSKFTPKSVKNAKKTLTLTSQTLQASASTLNVKVHDSQIRKKVKSMACLKGLEEKASSL